MESHAETDTSNIHLLLIDDNADYLRTFTHLIQQFSGIRCIGTFTSVEAALAGWRSLSEVPDILLVDIQIDNGMSGIEGVRHLKEAMPATPIVMLTGFDTAEFIFAALKAGADGYISKKSRFEEIAKMIRRAVEGALLMEPSVARKVLGFFRQEQPVPDYGISDREFEVLKLLCDGLSQREIADKLYIALSTVDNHVRSIYRKLHVHSGIQAVAKALREGLIDPSN